MLVERLGELEDAVDRNEKKRLRDKIGASLDVSGARLTDDEAQFLGEFVDIYKDEYRGRSETRTNSFTGWSSDGKYVRNETFTDSFVEDVGIQQDYEYQDDDGQHGSSSTVIDDARGVLNWFRDRR